MPGLQVLEVRARLRWWLLPYLHTLAFLCAVFDREPDWEKVEKMVKKGVLLEDGMGRQLKCKL